MLAGPYWMKSLIGISFILFLATFARSRMFFMAGIWDYISRILVRSFLNVNLSLVA